VLQRDFSWPKKGYVCNRGAEWRQLRSASRLLIAVVIGSFTGAPALAAGQHVRAPSDHRAALAAEVMVLALQLVAPHGLGGPSIIALGRVYPFGIASLNDRFSRN
jgi:hypothetical protein